MSPETTTRPIDLSIEIDDELTDVSVALRSDATGGELFALVQRRLRFKPQQLIVERTGSIIHFDTELATIGLLRGDVLTPTARRKHSAAQKVVLRCTEGEPGALIELEVDAALGRASSWLLDDHGVSRRHAMFRVGSSGTTVEDLQSSNGTWVNGVRIERPTQLSPGDKIEVGPRVFEFVSGPETARELQATHLVHRTGRLEFTRPPRERTQAPATSFTFPDPPAQPPKRRFPYAAALLPIVFGAAMVYFMGSWFFALFMAMGPIMVGWTFVEDKRTGRHDFADESAKFLEKADVMETEIDDAHAQAVALRRARVPANADLQSWARAAASQVWSRRPADEDFFRLAPADADQPTQLTVEVPDRGAADLLDRVADIRDRFLVDRHCPVEVVADGAIIGITGTPDERSGIARSLIAQACVLHSPRDLIVAVLAPTAHDRWEWSKWLPHVDPAQTGDSRLLGLCDESAELVFEALQGILERRRQESQKGQLGGGGGNTKLPHVLTVIEPPAKLSAREAQQFIEDGREFGFTTIYLGSDRNQLPGDTTVVIEPRDGGATVDVSLNETGERFNDAAPRVLSQRAASQLARELGPLVDVTAGSSTGEIPRSIALPELVDPANLTVEGIKATWQANSDHALEGILGAGSDGPYSLDLKARGPHGLVAGTTGAGKSELLQTMVMGLAIRHSPLKLNFIFIDYKANQIFQDLSQLPHSVGVVTNLDRRLVDRSLISLEAELRRRQRLFLDREVNDLKEMRNKDLASAPPFLYIIVDEFAALKTDAPEFLDGLVDIAQRGRSMGVHMVLATQKPAGIVPDQIDGNINVRVALRVASPADSQEVIGTTAAAEVSDTLPGRTFIKIGGGRSVGEFQAAYMGARSLSTSSEASNEMGRFHFDSQASALLEGSKPDGSGGADADVLIERICEAWIQEGSPELHLPWAPQLAGQIGLAELLGQTSAPAQPLDIALAVADLPDQQRQAPWSVDLTDAGNVAVYGTTSSGKTTLLRTMAASLSARSQPGTVAVYGLDFGAGGLASLLSLPTVGDVIPGQSIDRLELTLGLLETEIASRRALMGEHTADSWNSLMSLVPECPPFWVVMIDNFGSFWAATEELGVGNAFSDRFVRDFSEGRSVGVHFVITADQRNAIPHQLLGAVGLRLVQRMASSDEYMALDIRNAPSASEMPPGRTIVIEGDDIQIAVASHQGDATAAGQKAAIDRLADRLTAHGVSPTGRRFESLGETVTLGQLPPTTSLQRLPVGLTATLQPATIDFEQQPGLLVVGGQGSGRSTTLGAIARQLRPHVERLFLVAGKSLSPLIGSPLFDDEAVRDPVDFMRELAEVISDRADAPPDSWQALLLDDAEAFFESATATELDKMVFALRDAKLILVAATSTFHTARAYDSWIRSMRDSGHAIALQPDSDREGDLFDVPFPRKTAAKFPPGRGYYLTRGHIETIHLLSNWTDPQ